MRYLTWMNKGYCWKFQRICSFCYFAHMFGCLSSRSFTRSDDMPIVFAHNLPRDRACCRAFRYIDFISIVLIILEIGASYSIASKWATFGCCVGLIGKICLFARFRCLVGSLEQRNQFAEAIIILIIFAKFVFLFLLFRISLSPLSRLPLKNDNENEINQLKFDSNANN